MKFQPSTSIRISLSSVLVFSLAACQTIVSDSDVQEQIEVLTTSVPTQPQPRDTSVVKNANDMAGSLASVTEILPISDVWERVRAGFSLQEFYNHPDVIEELGNYKDNQAYFDLTIARAEPFLFAIVDELDQRGLPQELALLPFVESAFNPNANSGEYAVGLWQFMGATAASFGLQRDWWYDARRDPQASTLAALEYLDELYQQFDQDWLLALAAYNAGDGNVRRALRRNQTPDADDTSPFWGLPLPSETRSHVPRVLALASLVNADDHFGITLTPIANSDPLTRVDVGAQIDLAQVAQLAEIDYATLRALNPGYLQWATHPDTPQHISLPHAAAQLLRTGLTAMSPAEFLTWDHYEIKPGDTLDRIAKNLHTRVDILQRVNDLRGSQIIAGNSLLIPRGANSDTAITSSYSSVNARQVIPVPGSYRIRAGDNLWSIARRFDLHSQDIALWNGITLDSILRPGQIISLHSTASPQSVEADVNIIATSYIVRRGDSMASIAARFSTSLEALLEQNNISSTQLIFPGQIIQIRPQGNRFN